MILFLNKIDLFEKKLQKRPLNTAFPDYKGAKFSEIRDACPRIRDTCPREMSSFTSGPPAYDEAIMFLRGVFDSLNQVQRPLYTHETCATDTSQIQRIIESTIDTIVTKMTESTGFA